MLLYNRRLQRKRFDVTVVPRENMSVIIVDGGMRSHHFVTTVMTALQDYTSSITMDSRNVTHLRETEAVERMAERERAKVKSPKFNFNPRTRTRRLSPIAEDAGSQTTSHTSLTSGHKTSTVTIHGDCWVV